jgi:hypothetical protein
VAAWLVTALGAPATAATLDDVLKRAGEYVQRLQGELQSIVAEEQYLQDSVTQPTRPMLPVAQRRELRSDLLLVKLVDDRGWIEFRDVFEVDGVPVRDRDERLVQLFLQPSTSGRAQIEQIVAESARYNIGNIQRTVNTPVLALLYLQASQQERFSFKRTNDRRPRLARDAQLTAGDSRTSDIWTVEYVETQRPTLIRTTNKRDMPSKGRFWIDSSSGQILMSELVLEDRTLLATIDVSYKPETHLGLFLPIEMRERYEDRRGRSRIDGVATYGHFRQFQVKVDEKIGPVKEIKK